MQTALGGQQRHPGKCIFHFVGEWPLRPADAKTADVMIRSLNNCAGRGHIQIDKNGNARQMEFITLDRYVGEYYEKGGWHRTRKIQIMHSKNGAHIVPVKEL